MSGVPPELIGAGPRVGPESPVATFGVLSRSQIVAFTSVINGLSDSAASWRAAADQLDNSADAYVQQISAPGGTEWEGDAREAGVGAAYADRGVVWQAGEHMRAMSAIGTRGAQHMRTSQQRALEAITEAENDDFAVADDLTVTDQRTYDGSQLDLYQARQLQAEQHQSYIVAHARALQGELAETDTKLQAGASTLHGMIPSDWNTHKGNGAVRAVDFKQDGGAPADPAPNPQSPIDPRNPFVGDERFGHWINVVPPPYVGNNPPPPWTGHRSLEGLPGKGPAGPSGFYVPGGKTWADNNAPPFAYMQEQYRFRISGEDYTSYTRTVDGQQQQWVQYTYEAQKYTQVSFGGSAWAPKGPNEVTSEPGGVISGGLAGINPPPKIGPWQPITLPQIATLSATNPGATYYIPNGCGGQFTFTGGVPTGGIQPPPTPPSIIAAP